MLYVFAVGVLLELGMQLVPLLWRIRRIVAVLCMVCAVFASGGLVALRPNLFSVLLCFITLYRTGNYLRIVEQRMHESYLKRATRRTGLMLIGLQILTGVAWLAWEAWHGSGHVMWGIVAGLQAAIALTLLVSIDYTLRHTMWQHKKILLRGDELPTISVAIPARNETDDLQACLASVIASDYPKLEILVLDDCSQDRRTPEIIRGYAQDGVRFIQGDTPSDTWLPKNQAYDRLAREASGDYILFCGVDVRFAPDSIGQIASILLQKKKEMISLLPRRSDSVQHQSSITQAMRYFWELVPPRRLFQRPPVLSTCWMIHKPALMRLGGFQAVARSIVPEAFFARQLAMQDGYTFVRASISSGVESVKGGADQRQTALRTRYPQLHRRPENVAVLTIVNASFLLLPFVLAIGGFWLHIGLPAEVLAIIASLLLTATYVIMATVTRTSSWLFALISLPVGVAYDIGLLYYSMWRYEFSTVDWKDRNICVPAMHVIPHLPKLS